LTIKPALVLRVGIVCANKRFTLQYIEVVNRPGIAHINGDVYHMLTEKSHIGEAILAD
jgi:hypothetical protein